MLDKRPSRESARSLAESLTPQAMRVPSISEKWSYGYA